MPDYSSTPPRPKEGADALPSNSIVPPEDGQSGSVPPKKVEPVVKGAVKVRKKSGFGKFSDLLISKDATSVKSYIIMDVLIPAIKKAVSDIVRNGIDMVLYGESGIKRESSNASRVSYQRYYDQRNRNESSSSNVQRARVGYSYDDIVYPDRGTAEDVLSRMDELISTYSVASVADLYDLSGLTGNSTDNNYGWTDISSAAPFRTKDGYIIKFPAAMAIK